MKRFLIAFHCLDCDNKWTAERTDLDEAMTCSGCGTECRPLHQDQGIDHVVVTQTTNHLTASIYARLGLNMEDLILFLHRLGCPSGVEGRIYQQSQMVRLEFTWPNEDRRR